MTTETERQNFTAGLVAAHRCEPGKPQAFLWDKAAPGLGLRATPTGAKAYIFQGRFQGNTVRLTIGEPSAWSIPQAREKARELQRTIDQGRDPRIIKAETIAADVAKRTAEKNAGATVADVWAVYLADRKSHWGERHYADHLRAAQAGGEKPKRGLPRGSLTVPGPLHSLMSGKLADLDAETVEAWAKREAAKRPTGARLAWRLLKGFLGWCSEHREYAHLLPAQNPAKTTKSREAFGKTTAKKDALQREQLKPWFAAVGAIRSPAVSAYLRALLLTGARPGELLDLQWRDVETQWKALVIRDKVEGERMIPLTPYVAAILAELPKSNEWVFASERAALELRKWKTADRPDKAKPTGRITVPRDPHALACKTAGIEGLTLHGLRRSFSSLTEWLEIPAGVVAQIMGHKPSATAEKHYKVRPLDLLRMHHERIEAWILKEAGIEFDAKAPRLQAVAITK